MEAVIRSARLAIGRTVLAASALPAQPAASEQDADKTIGTQGPPVVPDPAAELAALKRQIEAELRAGLQAEVKRLVDAQREEAYRQGYAAGHAEGGAAAEKEAAQREAQRQAQWEALAASLCEAHEAAVQRLREDIGTLAFAALSRVLGEQAAAGVAVLGAVESVCREARVDRRAVARLHPRDIALLAPSGATLTLANGTLLDLVGDESIVLGGCIVESEAGQFDGTLDTQLRRLHSVLTAHVPS